MALRASRVSVLWEPDNPLVPGITDSHVGLLKPRGSGNKLTQKDNADGGVQFITPAGPRQSLFLAKDPDQFL